MQPVGMEACVQRVRQLGLRHEVRVDGLQAEWLLPDEKDAVQFWEWFGDLSGGSPLITALAIHDAKLAGASSQDGRLGKVGGNVLIKICLSSVNLSVIRKSTVWKRSHSAELTAYRQF